MKLMAFVATTALEKAKAFYRDTLGLRIADEDGFAVTFDVNGTMLRLTPVQKIVVAPYTVLGWQVEDIEATARKLGMAGVKFERYPGLTQDELGIWSAPGSARVAWFKDPDGNTLSISEHP